MQRAAELDFALDVDDLAATEPDAGGNAARVAKRESAVGRVSRTRRLGRTVRNCTRDEGGPFEAGSQVQVSSHRELLSSRAMVVSVAETSGHDPGRQG